jgi:hypothetical protein
MSDMLAFCPGCMECVRWLGYWKKLHEREREERTATMTIRDNHVSKSAASGEASPTSREKLKRKRTRKKGTKKKIRDRRGLRGEHRRGGTVLSKIRLCRHRFDDHDCWGLALLLRVLLNVFSW